MQASENGDSATVTQFSPMALAAYGMLDAIDADAQYHAAMIRLHTGDLGGAAALADTILASVPNHLLGWLVRGTVARTRHEQKALAIAERAFLAGYDAEISIDRPEYRDHKTILDIFLSQTKSGGNAP